MLFSTLCNFSHQNMLGIFLQNVLTFQFWGFHWYFQAALRVVSDFPPIFLYEDSIKFRRFPRYFGIFWCSNLHVFLTFFLNIRSQKIQFFSKKYQIQKNQKVRGCFKRHQQCIYILGRGMVNTITAQLFDRYKSCTNEFFSTCVLSSISTITVQQARVCIRHGVICRCNTP